MWYKGCGYKRCGKDGHGKERTTLPLVVLSAREEKGLGRERERERETGEYRVGERDERERERERETRGETRETRDEREDATKRHGFILMMGFIM